MSLPRALGSLVLLCFVACTGEMWALDTAGGRGTPAPSDDPGAWIETAPDGGLDASSADRRPRERTPIPRPAWVTACAPSGRIVYMPAHDSTRGVFGPQPHLVAVDLATGLLCTGPDLPEGAAWGAIGIATPETLLVCKSTTHTLSEIALADGTERAHASPCGGNVDTYVGGPVVAYGRDAGSWQDVGIWPSVEAVRRGDPPITVQPVRDWAWTWWERVSEGWILDVALDGDRLLAMSMPEMNGRDVDLWHNRLTPEPDGGIESFDPATWSEVTGITRLDVTPDGTTFVFGDAPGELRARATIVAGELERATGRVRVLTTFTETLEHGFVSYGLAVEP